MTKNRQHGGSASRPLFSPIAGFDLGLILAGLLALFVVFPLLRPGLPGTADTPIHFYRTLEFARSWGPGVFYPRWAPDLAYGYGYPLWNFVPPLPYLIPLVLQSFGLSLEASLKGLVIITTVGYALGAYLFVRDSLGPGGGLVGAAIYTLAPFALREVLLYGGNYPQYLAIGLFPWVLWALRRAQARGGWLNTALAAILYAGVILSHLFHALVLTPVAAAYAGLLWLEARRNARRPPASALALGLGLLGSAFFWLPALVERSFTRVMEDVFVSVSPFYLRFLSWAELLAWPQALDSRAANPWVPFSLGPIALLLAELGLLALVIRHPGRRPINLPIYQSTNHQFTNYQSINYQVYFFLALLALCVFMMLPASLRVWTYVPLLAVAEFPWRWLGLANLCLAFLGGASVHWLSPPRRSLLAGAGVLAVLLSSAVYLYPPFPFVRYGQSVADMTGYELAGRTIGTTTLGEYLPRWVTQVPSTSPLAEALKEGEAVEKLDRDSLPEGATAYALDQGPVGDLYRFESSRPFQARFFTFYFPGWSADLDGQPVKIEVEPESGLITVPVPAGSHELRLRFGDTPVRTVANVLSGLTLVTLFFAGSAQVFRLVSSRAKTQGLVGLEKRGVNAPDSPTPGLPTRWPARRAVMVGAGLIGLLLFKSLVVDPHTLWFRAQSPPGQVKGVQHPMHVNLDESFWLLGYDVDREVVPQGGRLRVVLYWQAVRPASTNYRSFVHLDAATDQRTWAGSDNYHPGDVTAQNELPTLTWDTTHYVRDEHVLPVLAHTPPVSLELRAGLYDPDTGRRLPLADGSGDTIRLQAVQVTPGRGLDPAEIPNPVDYRLGQGIRLLGYEWAPDEVENPPGGELTLYWQAGARVETDYVVFVHLLDEGGELAWGADGPPLGGLYPTSTWRPGAVVADPRRLALESLPPGAYTLAVGLYDSDSLARLPVSDGEGRQVAGDAAPLMRLSWP